MKVLVVGGGGREHALCWKLRQSPRLEELFCAPGNPGIGEIADLVSIAPDEIQKLADFAADLAIDLTVVGPELPLALGIADEFDARGLPVFGPRKRAAELEASKVFAKEFMDRHEIPTAPFRVAHGVEDARRAVKELGLPVVLKADGLAAGKGVVVARDKKELKAALATFFEERRFGAAGDRVVVERFLSGEEVSVIALCDGHHLLPLVPSKDYKRIGEGDQGPNTGGMGAHSPAGVLSAEEAATVMDRVMRPTIEGLASENRSFVGVLYAGLMLTDGGPQVLEFNVRLGDPEAQCILLRLEDDLLPVLTAGAGGQHRQQIVLQAQQERLRLRVSEPGVVLEHPRAVLGEHDPDVEHALELAILLGHAAQRRLADALVQLGRVRFRDHHRRAVGAHAAGVRAAVAVADPLVVLAGRQRQEALAVAQADQRDLLALEPPLDHDPAGARAEAALLEEHRQRRLQLAFVRRNDHALAGREAVRLEHEAALEAVGRAPGLVGVVGDLELRRRNAVALHELLGERLAAFDLGRLPARPEDAQPAQAELIHDAERQRQLGADDGQVDLEGAGEIGQLLDLVGGDRNRVRELRRAGIAGRAVELVEQGALPELPADGVLAPAASDYQYFHGLSRPGLWPG